ncbi:MAG: hypothetical protein NTV68_11870 [Methanomicrobiales archaeon]|nr:hypothetical protein [Methanomicrobiales archaeon]
MKKQVVLTLLIAAAVVILAAAPASAVIQEIVFRGTLASMNQSAGTITINAGYTYGCTFTNGTSTCTWDPGMAGNLTGTVPDPSVFTILKAGDPVVATSMGGPGGIWIGVAKVFPTPGIENWLATDIIGDPDSLPVDLAADYSFQYTAIPECGNCTGSVCNALSAAITLNSTDRTVLEKTLGKGESVVYNGRNDNSSVIIKFVQGQGLADKCPGKAGMVGLQPVSTFIIHVNQGLAAPAPTLTTPKTEAVPVVATTMTTSSPPVSVTSVPATKAAGSILLPFFAIGILGLFISAKKF